MLEFLIEWDGYESETLNELLEKRQVNAEPQFGTLNSHLITTRKSSSISETIALWMGYPGVPETIKNNELFISLLAITSIALLSPRSLKIVPDSCGEILNLFKLQGFYRVITKSNIIVALGDDQVANDGINFMLKSKLIEIVDDNTYRLLEVPLSNVKITLL